MRNTIVFVTPGEMQHLISYRAAKRKRFRRRRALQRVKSAVKKHFCDGTEIFLLRVSAIALAASAMALCACIDDAEFRFTMLTLFILACVIIFVPSENFYI